MNTDATHSINATSDPQYFVDSSSSSGLGILSPPSFPSPALATFGTLTHTNPQYVSSIGRVTNLSPSPPDYYSSLSAFTQPISATATGPLPVPIFATQPQANPVAPFIPPTPPHPSGSGFPLSRHHLSIHNTHFGHPNGDICDLSSPSAVAGSLSANGVISQRGLLAPLTIPPVGHVGLRQAVHQLPIGSPNGQTEERDLYAADLVEQMIETLFRIWPDHCDPDEASSTIVSPSAMAQTYFSQGFDPRFRHVQQQATPESSPDMVMSKNRKRKRAAVSSSSPNEASSSRDDGPRLTKRRATPSHGSMVGTAPRDAVHVDLPPVISNRALPLPHQATSTITLRIFCWELLRRSKTVIPTLEVAICYLDGVEDKVKELRECYMNGAVDFDCAPEMLNSRRRVYDEALRDKGRIIKMKDLIAQEKTLKEKVEALRKERSWRPLSPPDIDGVSRYSPLAFHSAPSCSPSTSHHVGEISGSQEQSRDSEEVLKIKREILSSHPLLDPRRTLLASLVLATKFLQDRAYSNRAWAKLSGLPGHEVGRCERALGGALGWRLWVGKSTSASGNGQNGPQSPMSEASSFTMSDSNSTMSSGDGDGDDGSRDPLFLKLVVEANHVASQRAVNAPARSTTLQHQPQARSGAFTRSMTWPQLPGTGSSLDYLRPRQHPLLGDYSSIIQSAHTFDVPSVPTPLPAPPPPNATVINSSGTWYSSYVCPQYLVDQKTATSLEDAKRILGEDGIDQYAMMTGYNSQSPLEHPVFASTSKSSGSGGLGGADCSSPSTPPFVHAWNNTHAVSTQEESSSAAADIDGLKEYSDYWINGDGIMPATYIPTSPLTITAVPTATQRDADDFSMASFRRQNSIMSTPATTLYGISRSSTLVADPSDLMDCSDGFPKNTKEKSDDMMAAITNGFGSASISSSKMAGLWSMPLNEQQHVQLI